jgi:hypothetical protein
MICGLPFESVATLGLAIVQFPIRILVRPNRPIHFIVSGLRLTAMGASAAIRIAAAAEEVFIRHHLFYGTFPMACQMASGAEWVPRRKGSSTTGIASSLLNQCAWILTPDRYANTPRHGCSSLAGVFAKRTKARHFGGVLALSLSKIALARTNRREHRSRCSSWCEQK